MCLRIAQQAFSAHNAPAEWISPENGTRKVGYTETQSVPVPPSTPSSRGGNVFGRSSDEQRNVQLFQVYSQARFLGNNFGSLGVGNSVPQGTQNSAVNFDLPGMSGAYQGFQSVNPADGSACGGRHMQGRGSFQGSSFVGGQQSGDGRSSFMVPGGLTPQASLIQQVVQLVGNLNPAQTRELHQVLGERTSSQSRYVPEFFGDVQRSVGSDVPRFGNMERDWAGIGTVGDWHDGSGSRERQLHVFSKNEKGLSPAPVPDCSKWVSRESEVTGFASFLSQLCPWAAQASWKSATIGQASRWVGPIQWDTLSQAQKNRSRRLFAILQEHFQRFTDIKDSLASRIPLLSAHPTK